MEQFRQFLVWLKKERYIGESPLVRSLGFFVIIVVFLMFALEKRGVDIVQHIERAYSFYFVTPEKMPLAPIQEQVLVTTASDIAPAPEHPNTESRLVHKSEVNFIPSVALHALDYAQYSQVFEDGDEMAELVGSLLMVELSQSDKFDLLDRSLVSTLFAEKTLLLASSQKNSGQETLKKLPISEFTLIGSLFSSAGGKSYSLKLIRNSTGQVVGASRFDYSVSSIHESIQKSSALVHRWFAETKLMKSAEVAAAQNKIAFGHFVDISSDDSQLNQGRDITERLIEKFVASDSYQVLSRTQMYPLLFEAYLRMLQHSDEYQDSKRVSADYVIYGKYRNNPLNSSSPLSIYLYLDLMKHGRELVVLNAKNWETAFELINKTVVNFLPKRNKEIDAGNITASQNSFIEAVGIRGVTSNKHLLSGRAISEYDITNFISTSKPEKIAPAKLLIERSLVENPENQFSKLVLAKILESEGDIQEAEKIVVDVLKSQEEGAADIAFNWIGEKWGGPSNIGPAAFDEIVGAAESGQVYQKLRQQEYLVGREDYTKFNQAKKAEQVFLRSDTLFLDGYSPDVSIQIFEKLRSLYYYPGKQVKYVAPRGGFHPRDIVKKKSWYQQIYHDAHNIEAVLHFDIARAASNIHIQDATQLPTVEFYNEVKLESEARRRSNLEIAVDGFSSSGFIDTSYLRSLIFLGHSLCQPEIGRCAAGSMVYSWVVDNTKPKNFRGWGGMRFHVVEAIEEKDRLIFLAADAVDRVHEANTTEMFTRTLVREKYFLKKYQAKLQVILKESVDPISEQQVEKLIYAYRDLLRAHCIQLMKRPRGLSRSKEYVRAMEDMATLSLRSDKATLLRESLLADLALQFPAVYPFLLINTHGVIPIISQEQDQLINEVAYGKIVPLKISDFMELALRLFESRVNSGDIEVAKRYIAYFIDFYSINEDTAIDFAYLYYRIGDLSSFENIMAAFGKNSFLIENFDIRQVNGKFSHNGFNEKGQLIFLKKGEPEIHFIYNAKMTHYGLGAKSIKWSLRSAAKHPYSGNKNAKKLKKFAFGNGGHLTGDIAWAEPNVIARNRLPVATVKTEQVQLASTGESILVAPFNAQLLNHPDNSVERLFSEGYHFDATQKIAIREFLLKGAIGPLRDSYFGNWFAKGRKINVVKEQLFEKGYLSVKGMPIFESIGILRKKVKEDFPDYTLSEQRTLVRVLAGIKKVKGAGYVEVYHRVGNSWSLASTLNPDDAINGRYFGSASAVTDKLALICSAKDGLYSFKQVRQQWIQLRRMDSKCHKVVMTNEWAAVSFREKVFIYKYDGDSWQKTQILVPDNYLVRTDKGHEFEYFGISLAILNDTLFIGNPYGGSERLGEVYLFSLIDDEWRQSGILEPSTKHTEFGWTVAANEHTLAIGAPSAGDPKTPAARSGAVFVYTKKNSKWKFVSHLVAENRAETTSFGQRMLLKAGQKSSLLIESRKKLYRYELLQ